MGRFFRDAINTLIFGESYAMYTAIRGSKELDRQTREIARLREKRNAEASKILSDCIHAEIAYDARKRNEFGAWKTEKQYLLERNGYKTFEHFLKDSQIKTREEWERFANSTRFHLFNDEYKKLHPEQYDD